MKKLSLLSALLFFINAAFCQGNYWQQKTDYRISVSLNDADHSLTGYEQIDYYNNSPDTLTYIWMHVWPNAYKNDRTAFSDQLLENGRTDFYFSEENKKGYINRLSFKVGNIAAVTQDHPQHQDIIKLILPEPLAPGKKIKIETPFHVKLPFNFSRGGHAGQSYQITQWYPKPAVYDRTGWHEIPYLDQGEFYSDFGNFDVQITLPENYVVAATGDLQNDGEKIWLKDRSNIPAAPETGSLKTGKRAIDGKNAMPLSSANIKTLHYIQDNVHDFAWFADKTFSVKHDTLILNSGRIIQLYSFELPANAALWKNSMSFIKKSVKTKSEWVGEYPYNVVSVVDNAAPTGGGMEYPTITLLNARGSETALEHVINHEIGHNWFYGILASDERVYPWVDEGMNTYYDKRYKDEYRNATDLKQPRESGFFKKRIPEDPENRVLETVVKIKRDQPINTHSAKFSSLNYALSGYTKASLWMQKLEAELGREMFDKVMKAYYEKWKFKHPAPEDFKATAEEVSGRSLTKLFDYLNTKGPLENEKKKQVKFASFFNLKETDKYSYVSISPAVGYNFYDKLMIGGLVHNYNLPPGNFQFIAAPLFSTGTQKLNGIGRVEYNLYPGSAGARVTFSLSGAKFTGDSFTDSSGTKKSLPFSKIVPSVKYVFANKNPRSHMKKFVQFKTFLINETQLLFTRDFINNKDIITYPKVQRYVNQLEFSAENTRVLYPYSGTAQAEQGEGFVRLNFTGNYFFNYAKAGGLNVRFFAGKFIYTGDKTSSNQFKTDRYHLNMSGPKGYEDYTYSNYFAGRNEFEGFSSQQIMNRDGFFKVRTDFLSNKIGKTDDWLSAINLTTDIPNNINPLSLLPFKIPVRLFADIGTYAEAWEKKTTTGRFLYDAGLQVSLFKNVINIYVPIVYSRVYSDYFKSNITEKRFIKNISFSIDVQQLRLSNFIPQLNL